MSFSVIIPAYNEADCILQAVQDVCKVVPKDAELIVVENGSSDNTAAIVKNMKDTRVKLVQLKKASFGGAIRAGVEASTKKQTVLLNADWIDTEFITKSVKELTKTDIVIGSKVLDPTLDHRPWVRRQLSKILTKVLSIFFGFNLSDSHGLKAWNASQNKYWLATTQNEIIETEFLIRAMHAGSKMKEIAVEITESRAPRISVYKRIFAMGSELRKLYAIRSQL